jgi:hypothetical protein
VVDTLGSIAKKFSLSIDDIRINYSLESSVIYPKQKLSLLLSKALINLPPISKYNIIGEKY